jgi:DNA-binding HxlR family transcriptional regulator
MSRPLPHSSQVCEKLQTALDLLGKRWTGLIVNALRAGPARYSRLKEMLEVVGDRMISERLKDLEEAGIVERRVVPRPVIRVEYALTAKGRALGRVFVAMSHWAEEWVELPELKSARGR